MLSSQAHSLARWLSCLEVCTKVLSALTEPGAGFLPFALCAPHLPVLHPVHLPALLGVSSRPSQGRLGAGAVGLGRQPDVLAGRLEGKIVLRTWSCLAGVRRSDLLTGRDNVEGGDGDCDGHGVEAGSTGRHGRTGDLRTGPLEGRPPGDDGGYGGAGGRQDGLGSPAVLGVLVGRPRHVLVVRDDGGLWAGRHHGAGAGLVNHQVGWSSLSSLSTSHQLGHSVRDSSRHGSLLLLLPLLGRTPDRNLNLVVVELLLVVVILGPLWGRTSGNNQTVISEV